MVLLPSADPHLFSALVQAYLDCRRTKRNSASALAFEAQLEHNLVQLHDELAECLPLLVERLGQYDGANYLLEEKAA